MTYPDDPKLDAIAWFISNDETHSGGEWEDKNDYWLAGRRAAASIFSCLEEITVRSKRHEAIFSARKWPEEIDENPNFLNETVEITAQEKGQ